MQDTVFEDSRVSDVLDHDKQQTTSVVDGPHIDTRVRNHLIDDDIEASTLSVSSITDLLNQIIKLQS